MSSSCKHARKSTRSNTQTLLSILSNSLRNVTSSLSETQTLITIFGFVSFLKIIFLSELMKSGIIGIKFMDILLTLGFQIADYSSKITA